jgi:nucleotide-binding universal stress UspA family protein
MYERIIVPLDGSKLAEAALPYAEELAAKMDSYISLLSVLTDEDAGKEVQSETYLKKIAELTKYHAAKYIGHNKGESVKVLTSTRTGDPAEAIIQYAAKIPFQLIIMASHGRSGLNRWAVGSVTDKVVRSNISQPVMLIRAKESRSDIREKRVLKKALVPLDGSEGSEAVIPYITKMASKLQMELMLLEVVPKDNHADAETYLQNWCTRLQTDGITAGYNICSGSIAEQIISVADELAFDLVAMTTHAKTSLTFWTLGSVAQKVFLGGNTPLLLIKQ